MDRKWCIAAVICTVILTLGILSLRYQSRRNIQKPDVRPSVVSKNFALPSRLRTSGGLWRQLTQLYSCAFWRNLNVLRIILLF